MNKLLGAIIIEGHIQGLSNTRSLGEEGIPVYVTDVDNCIAKYSKYCKKFILCPDYRTDAFIDFLINLAIAENLKDWVLIPSNDHIVYSISLNKHKLEQYYKIITPDIAVIDRIYDKLKLIEAARISSVPHPQTFTAADFHHEIYPVLIKGRNGLTFYKAFGKKVFMVSNKNAFNECMQKINHEYQEDGIFIQELIGDKGKNKAISFAAFAVKGEIKCYWMGMKLREHPVEFGTGTLAESVYIEDCLKQSSLLLKELSYTGVCEIEYLLDPKDNQYKLIEMNARTWLWVELARICKIDFAKYIYDYLNQIPVNYPLTYNTGVKWMNIWTDTIYSFAAILQRKLSISGYFRAFKGGKVHLAAFHKSDMKPFFMYALLLFKFFKTRR